MTLNNTNITIIRRLLGGKNTRPLRGILSKLSPSDLASLFNHLSGRETNLFVDALIALDNVTTVLLQVPYQKLTPILSSLDKNKLLVILNYSSEDEAAEILSLLHEDYCNELLDPVGAFDDKLGMVSSVNGCADTNGIDETDNTSKTMRIFFIY